MSMTNTLEIMQRRAADGHWRIFYQEALNQAKAQVASMPDTMQAKYLDRIREVELARDHAERVADAAALVGGDTRPIYQAFEKAMDTRTPPPLEILTAANRWVERYLEAGQVEAAQAMQDRLEMWTGPLNLDFDPEAG